MNEIEYTKVTPEYLKEMQQGALNGKIRTDTLENAFAIIVMTFKALQDNPNPYVIDTIQRYVAKCRDKAVSHPVWNQTECSFLDSIEI